MVARWTFDRHSEWGGRFQVVIRAPGVAAHGTSFIRGTPIQLESFSSADPFGDSTAVLSFPQLTAFDDLDAPIMEFLNDFSDVDIWWIPGMQDKPDNWDLVNEGDNPYLKDMFGWHDPLTNETIYAPAWNYTVSEFNLLGRDIFVVHRGLHRGTKVWEGFIASIETKADSTSSSISIQCQGALYQLDRYLEKPFYPPRPQSLESLIHWAFSHNNRPNLRTRPLVIRWPTGWDLVGPPYFKNTANLFTPNVRPGQKWTGYSSRQTGSWDHSLTSFIQNQLAVMITQDKSGVAPGNQWTVMQEHQRVSSDRTLRRPGRTPVLRVRDRFAEPDFEIWLGTPGIEVSLTRDTTQMANVIYGDGTGVDGTVWRNVVMTDGGRTDYLPLAHDRAVYPAQDNPRFNRHKFVSESYLKYGTGFDQTAATHSAQKTLQRDMDPGWSGTITLSIDPSQTRSRFLIRAGTALRLKGFMGTGEAGMTFHIASVDVSVTGGTVTLKVDTRFRDLLNLEEALARNRDPLTPAKLLQVNRASASVEDIMAPWDYTAGSGFIPKKSKELEKYMPHHIQFPYEEWTKKYPPHAHPEFYIKVNAASTSPRNHKHKWTERAVHVLMSEKGSISHTEMCAYDRNGNVLKIPFHMSVYKYKVTFRDMPYDTVPPGGTGPIIYSPFIHGAFETINPQTGFEWSKDTNNLMPSPDAFIIGWGNYRNKAGYSPGRMTNGGKPTGKLVDDFVWSYDMTDPKNFDRNAKPGSQNQKEYAISVYVMLYAERDQGDVYFRGRFYHQNMGA